MPIAFLLKGRRAALVGGDERGLSKAHALLQAEALVLIYSDQPAPQLQQFASEHVEVQIKPLDELKQATALSVRLIIVGWEQNIDRQRLTARAQSVGVPVNVIDAPEHCDFFFPAVVDRGPIKVAITTGGVSPFLARWIRQKLETTLSFGLPKIAALLQQVNQWLKDQSMPIHQRTSILGTIVEGPAAQAAETGSMEQALNLAHQQIKQTQMQGSVAIVGAGPGHPELLTLQGKRLLQRADVVLYDRLVDPSILNLAARDARKISVGKKPAESRQSQQQIHDTMIELAQQGLQVCRLKGGDPFIFGRLGEEIQALKQANIPFELAPGISSASGCAAWAGISL
ncbi:MAG: SAM-dependent methyltransferase, partial [Gammaproteobacteria bacterium]